MWLWGQSETRDVLPVCTMTHWNRGCRRMTSSSTHINALFIQESTLCALACCPEPFCETEQVFIYSYVDDKLRLLCSGRADTNHSTSCLCWLAALCESGEKTPVEICTLKHCGWIKALTTRITDILQNEHFPPRMGVLFRHKRCFSSLKQIKKKKKKTCIGVSSPHLCTCPLSFCAFRTIMMANYQAVYVWLAVPGRVSERCSISTNTEIISYYYLCF